MMLKRIFAGHSPFRLTAIMTAGNIAVGVASFYYMQVIVGSNPGLRGEVYKLYGGPAGFMAVGVSLNALLTIGVNAVARSIKDERSQGTFGFWTMCRRPIVSLVLQSSLGEFLLAGFNAIVTFTVLVLVFRVHFDINIPAALLVGLVAVLCATGVGLAAAGIYVGGGGGRNPVLWAWGLATNFMCGVFVPIEVFTNPILRVLTHIVPNTYVLLAMRGAVLRNQPVTDPALLSQLLYPAVFAAVALFAGVLVFERGVRRALRLGGLIES
ncbi:MAG TPA: ABC transporter permease [Candidatus Acidoferrales bacterium]|nr:ABC transporter permease [Candidatus Acidoferrales bacterium]